MDNIGKFATASRSMFLTPGYVGGVFKHSGAVWRMPCGYGGQAHAVDARRFKAACGIAGKNLTIDDGGRLVGTTGAVQIDDAGIGLVPDGSRVELAGVPYTLDLRKLAVFASKDGTRRNICGVLVEAAGVAVAVNGHVLRSMPVAGGYDRIVPRELAAIAPVTVYATACTGGGAVVNYVDDTFPNWRHVVPQAVGEPFTIDAPAKIPGSGQQPVRCVGDETGWTCTRADGFETRVPGTGAAGRVLHVAGQYLPHLAGADCYHSGNPWAAVLTMRDGVQTVVKLMHA